MQEVLILSWVTLWHFCGLVFVVHCPQLFPTVMLKLFFPWCCVWTSPCLYNDPFPVSVPHPVSLCRKWHQLGALFQHLKLPQTHVCSSLQRYGQGKAPASAAVCVLWSEKSRLGGDGAEARSHAIGSDDRSGRGWTWLSMLLEIIWQPHVWGTRRKKHKSNREQESYV